MLKLTYLIRNLTRNPLRTLLTCAAVALPIMIFVLSVSVIDGINRFLNDESRLLRLAVTHKASIVNPLPEGYRAKIETLDPSHEHLVSVCGLSYLGGMIENDPRPLSTLGADPDSFVQTFPEYLTDPAEREAWSRDRQAIVIGRATAEQFGWKVGDRITIRPSLPPYTPMEFKIVSTAADVEDAITNFCRRDYVQEEIKKAGEAGGKVSFFFVKCASTSDIERFRREIDALFAKSADETLTQDEKSFMSQFINQQFNLPQNLSILAAVTVLVAVLAAANTMGMNFRDRLNEFATLKSMGFGARVIFGMIQFESLMLCATGGVIGAAVPYVVFTHTPLKDFTVPLIQHLDVHLLVCAQAVGISVLIGLIAAAGPSWQAARLRVVQALRTLE